MSTAHIEAKKGDFAETVLMPGDPLRAKFIAENYLEGAELVTSVRNMLGYTGKYGSKTISVMGSGMGIPSISIYSKELFTEYDVKNIIRIGSCGTVVHDAKVGDVVIGMGACTDSKVNRMRLGGHDYAAIADFELLRNAVYAAERLSYSVKVGNLFSADLFYTPEPELFDDLEKMGVVGIEMEAAGLYGCAAEFGGSALAICTVSDQIRTGESLSSKERETSLSNMIEIALDAV
ncbi:purine-nucleoside phosphorylase [Puniceicoccaceae bacterium K14]|nr:purine-nucleoside phosphorylase [Puniceicoccaceae bacterium K14]